MMDKRSLGDLLADAPARVIELEKATKKRVPPSDLDLAAMVRGAAVIVGIDPEAATAELEGGGYFADMFRVLFGAPPAGNSASDCLNIPPKQAAILAVAKNLWPEGIPIGLPAKSRDQMIRAKLKTIGFDVSEATIRRARRTER